MKKVTLKKVLSLKRFNEITGKYSRASILVAGDVILDRFVYGSVSRISPEAPVPVVLVHREECLLGGAGNVALNLKTLGAHPFLLAAVGRDSNGTLVRELLKKNGIDSYLIERDTTTTTKTRVIARTQQVVRIDSEVINRLNTAELQKIKIFLREKTESFNGIIISDYNKGFITKQLISLLFKDSRKHGNMLMVDPKVEHFPYYKKVTCITPNKTEASLFMHSKEPEEISGVEKLGRRIQNRLRCENLLITLGKDGMLLLEKTGRAIHIPTAAREVFDVTGAGDTVIGVFTLSLSVGASALESAVIANLAAGITVAKLGTATASLKELRDAFKKAGSTLYITSNEQNKNL